MAVFVYNFVHKLWAWWWRFEVKIATGTRSNRRPNMAKKSRVTTTRLVLHHGAKVARNGDCGIVLNLTRRNTFTTADCVRNDSGWSWTFWIARVTLNDCEVAPLRHRSLHVPFLWPSVWRQSFSSNFDVGPSPSDSTKKKTQSLWFWSKFPSL